MKKIFTSTAIALMGLTSYADSKQLMMVIMANPLALECTSEMAEVPVSNVTAKLQLADTIQTVMLGEGNRRVSYQVTYDEEVILPVTVKANGTAARTIQSGTPNPHNITTCSHYYPGCLNDMAWENDLDGYRVYGPVLQKHDERGFGYDLSTGYNTTEPILGSFYAEKLGRERRARIAELKKTDPRTAAELQNAISYHTDHGYGMDCYAVGPTLDCGTVVLMASDTIIYPCYYRTQETLDNGPLHFIVKPEFSPLTVRGDSSVIETRVITLDASSYLNKIVVSYTSLKEAIPMTTGIVLREPGGMVTAGATNGYIACVDPIIDRSGGNGKILIGAIFLPLIKEAETVLFLEEEKKELRGKTDGHVLTISEYEPGSKYIYYWSSAQDEVAIRVVDAWDAYMTEYAQKVRTPLAATY